MTRSAVILSLLLAAACDVGDASGKAGGKMDAGSGSGADAATIQAHQHQTANQIPAGNATNAGQGCMSANCHGTPTGSGATAYTFGGTVYADANHTVGAPGVTVKVVCGANTATAVTDTAGNFYSSGTTLAFPCNTNVTTASMAGQLTTGGGNCNSTSCHQQPGGSQLGIYK